MTLLLQNPLGLGWVGLDCITVIVLMPLLLQNPLGLGKIRLYNCNDVYDIVAKPTSVGLDWTV